MRRLSKMPKLKKAALIFGAISIASFGGILLSVHLRSHLMWLVCGCIATIAATAGFICYECSTEVSKEISAAQLARVGTKPPVSFGDHIIRFIDMLPPPPRLADRGIESMNRYQIRDYRKIKASFYGALILVFAAPLYAERSVIPIGVGIGLFIYSRIVSKRYRVDKKEQKARAVGR